MPRSLHRPSLSMVGCLRHAFVRCRNGYGHTSWSAGERTCHLGYEICVSERWRNYLSHGHVSDGEYTVTVRDEGIGFSKDFETSRPSGLGLRLVRSFNRQLGATISFSEPGRGGTIKISFSLWGFP